MLFRSIPAGVKVALEGNLVTLEGPKGKLETPLPPGIRMEQRDGHLVAVRETDEQAALHGLARALINNAMAGVTKGWSKELEIVGIGYRAELKGKSTVVFSLGYSAPVGREPSCLCPALISVRQLPLFLDRRRQRRAVALD